MSESLLSAINLSLGGSSDSKSISAVKLGTAPMAKLKPSSGSYSYMGWNINQYLPSDSSKYFGCILVFNHITNMSGGKNYIGTKSVVALTDGGTYNGNSNLSMTPLCSATLQTAPSIFGYTMIIPLSDGWIPFQSFKYTGSYGGIPYIKDHIMIFAGDEYMAYEIQRITGNMSCDVYGLTLG